MIRRDPTMIPMTDNDIQEVRNKMAEKRRQMGEPPTLNNDGIPPGYGVALSEAERKKYGLQ